MKKLHSIFAFLLVSQMQAFAQGTPNSLSGLYLDNQPIDDTRIIELFAGDTLKLEWRRSEYGGNYYYSPKYEMEGWLCPALFKYYKEAPQEIYIRGEPIASSAG